MEEETDQYAILVNQELSEDVRSAPSAVETLFKSVIDTFASSLQSNYCKYFVNNSIIIDGGKAFANTTSSNELSSRLNKYIASSIEESQVEKSKCELYTESFNFRPFFGEGINKLPKCDRGGELSGGLATWNWDDLYINPGMESEVFVKVEKTKVVDEAKPEKQSQGAGTQEHGIVEENSTATGTTETGTETGTG